MKYLKYFESRTIGTPDGRRLFTIVEGQPKHGPTVICFKNPDTEKTLIAYTGKNIYKEDESPIQYTWRYEASYNGHPAIIVNFSRIDSGYRDHIVCLESNNMSKGTGYKNKIPSNKYKLNGENNNRALNVFNEGLLTYYEDITYYTLGNITLNRDYPIYITVPRRYVNGAIQMNSSIPNDWEVRINVRPTIRGDFSALRQNIDKLTFRHAHKIPAKEYISVKFPYVNIFEL